MKDAPKPFIPPRLTFRNQYRDGRVTCMISFPDGGWKVEVFASVDHAIQFCKENSIEIDSSS
jgi:hypothetical protein